MAEWFECDVVVDNDVHRASGRPERLGVQKLPRLVINIDRSIGGGFVSESGLLLTVPTVSAGDIGHVRARGSSDAICS